MTTNTDTTGTTSIDPGTQVGLLSLKVGDLDRSLTFYTAAFGFEILDRSHGEATLGAAGTPLLLLTEEAGARPFPHDRYGYTGLYHFAILMPTRADLGRWLRHWLDLGFPLPGQGDHVVSEALYLSDPDGNGIEIYRDRPRDEWRTRNGQVVMGTGPVDIEGILADAERDGKPWNGLAAGTRLGHMHLQVGDISQASTFYHDILGFDIMAQMPSALFISAGGYHHHIGMNTWHSQGADPAPAGVAGLRFFTVDFPTDAARQEVIARIESAGVPLSWTGDIAAVQDPWSNTLLLQVRSATDTGRAAALRSAFTAVPERAPVS